MDTMPVPEAKGLIKAGGSMAKSARAQKSKVGSSKAGNRPVAVVLSGRALRRAQATRNKQVI